MWGNPIRGLNRHKTMKNHISYKTHFILVFMLAAILFACGDERSGPIDDGEPPVDQSDSGNLVDREFWSTAISENGEPRALVNGTRISLTFGDGTLGASAGCNSMGAGYTLEGESPVSGTLVVGEMSMTEMGCDEPRHAQDTWLMTFLRSSPRFTLDGDTLTLASDDVLMQLLDREIADPDRRLDGTEWIVTGFLDGETATDISVPTPATVIFDNATSMISGTDGCNSYAGSVEISDGSTGGPVAAGDGELQFGPIESEQELCEGYEDYQPRFHAVFESGRASYVIDGPNLTILGEDGSGLTLRAADA